MLRLIQSVALILLFAGFVFAQEKAVVPPAQEPAAVFKAKADLVLVPVVVTNKKGAHISGLKPEDFILREDGHDRKISTFEEIHTSTEPLQKLPPQPPGTFSNFAQVRKPGVPRRLVIIALDTLHTSFGDQAYAREHILKFLRANADSGTLFSLMVIKSTGVSVVHDFTTDTRLLAAAIDTVHKKHSSIPLSVSNEFPATADAALPSAQPGGGLPESNFSAQALQNEVNQLNSFMEVELKSYAHAVSMDCLKQIAQVYAGVPGRKALIWVSGGFPFVRDFTPEYRRLWQIFNNANIVVYPVDARGLVNYLFNSPASAAPLNVAAATTAHFDRRATFDTFADMTGGKAFHDSNDLKTGFELAVKDSEAYYVLGYYLDKTESGPGWHDLKVKVNVPGADVRARKNFLVQKEKPNQEREQKEDVDLAVRSPINFTGVPFSIRWESNIKTDPKTGKRKVPYVISLPPGAFFVDETDRNYVKLEFIAVAVTPKDISAGVSYQTVEVRLKPKGLAMIRADGIRYRYDIVVPKGDYTVRFVARDSLTGQIGSVQAPLKVN